MKKERKKKESLTTRKQSGLPPSPSLPNTSPAAEATQGASCTTFAATLAPRAPRGHIVAGCAAESIAAKGRGPWSLERGRELALVFFSSSFVSMLFSFAPSLTVLIPVFFYFAFSFSLLWSAHLPVPLALSRRALALSTLPARARGGTRKKARRRCRGKGGEEIKQKKKTLSPTMPPADADDSLGKNSRYYKVGRVAFGFLFCACGEPPAWSLSARGVSVRSWQKHARARERKKRKEVVFFFQSTLIKHLDSRCSLPRALFSRGGRARELVERIPPCPMPGVRERQGAFDLCPGGGVKKRRRTRLARGTTRGALPFLDLDLLLTFFLSSQKKKKYS